MSAIFGPFGSHFVGGTRSLCWTFLPRRPWIIMGASGLGSQIFLTCGKKTGWFLEYIPPSQSNRYFVTKVYSSNHSFFPPRSKKVDKLAFIYFFGTTKNTSLPQKYTSQTKYFFDWFLESHPCRIQEQQQQTNQWVLTPVQFNLVTIGTSGRRCSRSPFRRSTGNDVSGH